MLWGLILLCTAFLVLLRWAAVIFSEYIYKVAWGRKIQLWGDFRYAFFCPEQQPFWFVYLKQINIFVEACAHYILEGAWKIAVADTEIFCNSLFIKLSEIFVYVSQNQAYFVTDVACRGWKFSFISRCFKICYGNTDYFKYCSRNRQLIACAFFLIFNECILNKSLKSWIVTDGLVVYSQAIASVI